MSTGQGLLGNNMFAYCNNSPILNYDPEGYRYAIHAGLGGGPLDYIIYYFHPDSTQNLDGPAKQNHSTSGSNFVDVSSFEELYHAMNSVPRNTDNVYIYLHGGRDDLCFYKAKYFYADDISDNFKEIAIYGDIYLFSCKGGRGNIASTIANATNCTVIASEYKMSFDDGVARCGWWNYFWQHTIYGEYTWYSFSPNGTQKPYSVYYIYTQK